MLKVYGHHHIIGTSYSDHWHRNYIWYVCILMCTQNTIVWPHARHECGRYVSSTLCNIWCDCDITNGKVLAAGMSCVGRQNRLAFHGSVVYNVIIFPSKNAECVWCVLWRDCMHMLNCAWNVEGVWLWLPQISREQRECRECQQWKHVQSTLAP